MKPVHLKTLAAIGAVALAVSLPSASVWAAAYELDSGVAVNVPVNAQVDQTSDVTVANPVDFGDIGIKQDAVDTATITMDPVTGIVTEDLAGPARIVTDSGVAPALGQIDLIGGFPTTDIHVVYAHNSDLNCGACLASPDLALDDIADSMLPAAALTNGTGVQQGTFATEGIGTTTALGELSWEIGATISTIAGAAPYETGAYSGSFDMTLSY